MLVTDLIFKNAGIIGQAASRVPQEAGRVPPGVPRPCPPPAGLPWEKFLSASTFHELPGGPDNVRVPQEQEQFFFPLLLGVAPPGGPGRQTLVPHSSAVGRVHVASVCHKLTGRVTPTNQ